MTKVKICGITNLRDALFAVEAGADALGFVFYAPSSRYITPDRAREIILRLPPFVAKVGVFVTGSLVREMAGGPEGRMVEWSDEGRYDDLTKDHLTKDHLTTRPVREIMTHCHLDYAQLHGDEPPEQVVALAPRAIKAVQVRTAADVERLSTYQAAAYLLDTYHPTKMGGTGATWNWELAIEAKKYGPIIVAGGLTPENVANAIQQARPHAVDVSSGVEAAPGIKDHQMVQHFIIAAKGA